MTTVYEKNKKEELQIHKKGCQLSSLGLEGVSRKPVTCMSDQFPVSCICDLECLQVGH